MELVARTWERLRTRSRVRIGLLAAVLAVVALTLPSTAGAATASLVPNADHAGNSAIWIASPSVGVGAVQCTLSTFYGCVDETAGGGYDDTDYVRMTAAGAGGTHLLNFDVDTIPSAAYVTNVVIKLRTQFVGSIFAANLNGFRIKNAAGTTLADSGAASVSTSSVTTVTATLPAAAMSKPELDGMWIQVDHDRTTSAETRVFSVEADVTYFTTNIAGTVALADRGICNNVAPVIRIAVNSTSPTSVPCDPTTGAYAAAANWNAGDIITAYYDGVAAKAVHYVRTLANSGTPLTGVDLAADDVQVESLSGAFTVANFAYDFDNDTDIPAQTTGAGPVTLSGNARLFLAGGTFTPGQNVTMPRMWIDTGATYTAGATTLTISGTGTGSCAASTTAVPFCNSGTFTAGTSTVVYTGNGALNVPSGVTFATLTLNGSTSSDFRLGAAGAPSTMTIGTLNLTVAAGAPTTSTSSSANTVTVTGAVTIAAGATLRGSSSVTTIQIAGNLTGAGAIDMTDGTIELRSGAAQTINPTSAPWQFATLIASQTATRTLTLTAGSAQIQVATLLQIGKTGDTGTVTFAAGGAGNSVAVAGDLTTIASRGVFTAPPVTTVGSDVTNAGTLALGANSLTVNGNFTSSGTLSANTSTVVFSGAATTSVIANTGTGSLYNVSVTAAGKELQVGATTTVITNSLVLNGGSCANAVTFRSSVVGTQRAVNNPASTTIAYARIQDISFTTPVTATNSVNLGNNGTNPTFAASPCAPLVPNGDVSGTGTITVAGGGGCLTTAKWECTNESVFAPTDTDYFAMPTATASNVKLDLTTTALTTFVTGVDIHYRMNVPAAATCSTTMNLRKADNTLIATRTANSTTTLTNYNASVTGLALTQADVDGLQVDFTTASCAQAIRFTAISVDLVQEPATIFGTADNTAICDGVTPVIGIALNTAKVETVACAAGTGAFYSAPTFAVGDTITTYYDGVAGGAANAGATWVKAATASTTTITGVQLNRTRYRTEARSVGTPLTDADIAKWDMNSDSDIVAYATGGMTVGPNSGWIEIGTNSFRPSGLVVAQKLWVRSGATYDALTTGLQLSGNGTGLCDDSNASTPLCVAGTGNFSAGTGSVTYLGTGATSIPGIPFAGLSLQAASPTTYSLGDASGATTLSATSLTLAGTSALIATTTAAVSAINVTGAVTVGTNATLQGGFATTWTIGGTLSGDGNVNLTGGTVDLRGGSASQLNASGTLPGTAWQFATLTFTSTAARTVTIPATSREIRASVLFQVGRTADGQLTTVNASALTRPISVVDFTNTNFGNFSAPPSVFVTGNFSGIGTMSDNGGLFTFNGGGTSLVGQNISQFAKVTISGTTTVSLTTGVTFGSTLTLAGTGCGALATLQSSAAGSARTVFTSGVVATNAAFRDIFSMAAITATSSINLGGNTNITYGANPCGSVQGTVSDTSICNGSTAVVGVAVNGVKFGTVPCTAGTGAYQAAPTWAAGDIVTVYYDDTTPKGSVHTRTTASSGTPLTGVDVGTNEVRVRTLAAAPITVNDINQYDGSNDADIPANYPGSGTFTVNAGTVLSAVSGNFQPGATTSTPSLWVHTAATLTIGGAQLTITDSGAGACTDVTIGRPFCVAGTYVPGTGSLIFTSTGATALQATTFANLTFASTGAYEIGAGTLAATSLTLNNSANVSTSANAPNITVSGAVAVNNTSVLGGSGSGTTTIGGNLTGNGLVNFTGGTVDLRSAGAAQQLNAGGTLPGTPWQFATLTFSTSAGARTVTIPATSREIRASGQFNVGNAADTNTTTLDASALTRPILITGSLDLTSRGSLTAPPVLEVHGNLTHTGTLTAGTGLIRVAGTGTSIFSGSGSGPGYDIEVVGAPKVLELANGAFISHALTLTGGSCANPVTMRSTSAGVPRPVSITGATLTTSYASMQDLNFSQAKTATSAGDLGGNTNITFPGSPCAAPSGMFTDSTNASTGATQPTAIDGRAAFHMSALNQTGATADRYRSEVSTSVVDSSTKALLALDGSGADRSALNNAGVASGGTAYVAGGANFGQAASFDGVDDLISAPSNVAYDATTFTVDFWMRASGHSPNTNGAMVARSGATNIQFAVYTNAASDELRGGITAGGVSFITRTAAAPWLDNTWHHVAFTADATKTLRLYVDGVQYGTPVTYTGTLDTGAWPLTVGGTGSPSNYFQGMVDDVQLTTGAPDVPAVTGYAATKRPHAQSIWQSTGYGTNSGAALSGNCSAAARCADIVYGGGSIREDGARYYATHQLRTTSGLWSGAASDWFETRDGIVVSAPASVTLPTGVPGVDRTTSFNVSTTCSNAAGCALQISTPSETVGLVSGTTNATNIPLYTRGAPTVWNAGTSAGLGFTVLASSDGKSTATWGTGIDFSNLALLKFTGAGRTPTNLQTMASGAETTSVGIRLNAPTTQAPGTYTGSLDVIALDAP